MSKSTIQNQNAILRLRHEAISNQKSGNYSLDQTN